jgi:hypothetical protein
MLLVEPGSSPHGSSLQPSPSSSPLPPDPIAHLNLDQTPVAGRAFVAVSYGDEALAIDLDHIQHVNPSGSVYHPDPTVFGEDADFNGLRISPNCIGNSAFKFDPDSGC